jgi:acyl-CoA-binding protein
LFFQPGTIMSDLQARFDQAQIDVHGDKPGFTDIVGRYKYEAWEGLKGTSQDDAKQKYIDLVEELKSGATT